MQLKKNMKKNVTNMNSKLPNWPKPAQTSDIFSIKQPITGLYYKDFGDSVPI